MISSPTAHPMGQIAMGKHERLKKGPRDRRVYWDLIQGVQSCYQKKLHTVIMDRERTAYMGKGDKDEVCQERVPN